MTTAVALQPTHTSPTTASPEVPPSGRTVSSIVTAAADVVAGLPLDDPLWKSLGPQLTMVVHAARLAAGMPGSPIRPDEAVAVVLRLRDLARLAEFTAASATSANPEAEAGLQLLQAAAASR